MHINCCNANGPRGFMMIPSFAFMQSEKGIYVNMYGNESINASLKSGNKVKVEQVSDYPVSGQTEITLNPDKPENFSVFFRIPSWSRVTEVLVNGSPVTGITPGTYLNVTRLWNKNDKVAVKLDMAGRLIMLDGQQAIVRGPVVLARDARFNDGFVYETAVVSERNGYVELKPSDKKPAGVWMSFTAPLVLGTDLEGEFRNPRQVNFCDFASAGNTWGEDSRYKVWIPRTLNVMKADYKSY